MIPHDVAVRIRRKQMSDYRARAKYETSNPNRNHHNPLAEHLYRGGWHDRPFIFWDGEGPQDAGYALFGNSAGYEVCHPYLGTVESLSLVMDTATEKPGSIHTSFGFNYDVSMILRELDHRSLRALHTYTRTFWRGWEIEHIPHKWVEIKYGNTRCVIYDIRSFFPGAFQGALESFGIATAADNATIRTGKANRENFLWRDIAEIREYWRTELRLGVDLCEELRRVFYDAGYVPRRWHGPGALSRMALQRHNVYAAKAITPVEVQIASQYAFAAGRFELFIAGHVKGRVYNADKNSAYPYFATQLPNLNHGKWRRTRNYEPGKFGVYHISYDARPSNTRAFPLFRRLTDGRVVWPNRVTGWYWNPEAELVAGDNDANFLEGWVFDEDDTTDRPFAWVAEYYEKRKRLKDAGSAAEYTFKLIINAIYGQLAQRAGWDRKNNTPPRSHQLEWAGYITSGCRAEVYKAATACGEKLISIDTDGIYSLAPIPGLDIGSNLGEWSTDEYTDGIFWQSGIYCLSTETGWRKAKSRGIKKGSYTADDLLNALQRDKCDYPNCTETDYHIHLSRRMFITYGLADIHGWGKHNTWIDEPHVYVMGGSKRAHFPRACATTCSPPTHRLYQWSPLYGVMPDDDGRSVKHPLPWYAPDADHRYVMRELELFDANHLSEDDLWVYDEYNKQRESERV